ncbi:MAG TPA: putative Ig domain-containing protein [Streptosporangiaceae bacterium]
MQLSSLRSRSRGRAGLARAAVVSAASAALLAAGLSFAAGASAQPARPAQAAAGHHWKRACPLAKAGHAACNVIVNADVAERPSMAITPAATAPTTDGFGPSSLQSAYQLPSSTAGSGQTVAVVDAMDDPNAAADLATYRSDFGLPACGSGCFTKVGQTGSTTSLPAASGSSGWATEESLDIDMVSAICPNCHILLVEANSASDANLGAAVNEAVALGAKFVSNSYGGPESTSDPTFDTEFYKHAGVAITASAGDGGFGVEYPAASQFVTAVGGTALKTASSARGWTESTWNTSSTEGTGSGCSKDDAKPSWQTDTGCAKRTNNDVSAVADPATGVAVYDTYDQNGFLEVGGTSASSPIIAATYALAGSPAAGTFPSSYLYQHTGSLFDVTTGATATCSPSYLCTAGTGYDGPTGLGTPDGVAAFSAGTTTGSTVTVTSPGSQTGTVGTAASLQVQASDSASGQTLAYSAAGLPAGLSINATTGLISGTPTAAATSSVTVTAKDSAGASGSASFSWVISAAGTGSGCTAAQLLGNPGFETGTAAPWSLTAGVLTNKSAGVPAHGGSWLAWMDGYGSAHTDTVSQSVTIPAGCKSATLSFWLQVQSNELSASPGDTFTVQVLNSSGTVLATLGSFSNQNASTAYVQHSFSLTPFIGQKVTVKFTGKETLTGGGANTSFFDDDNAVSVS